MLHSQEALKSAEEDYYDFLALQGLAERPYLNYRTLSDSAWSINEGARHPWQDQNLGIPRYFLDGKLKLKFYGPELFTSFNTAAPYGQNDGALWQGKGFNASFTGGVRLEAYGVEATFKPQLAFSQNLAFDIMPSAYENEYGYFWGYGVDAPQRFGDKPFFTWDWGDSEIRYAWKTLTVGFGTQAIWLGPAYLNSILHSNNAPTYPKFDIGLRKQPVTIPWINWYAGDIEFRLWVGYLSESKYFDSNDSNDHNMFHGLSFSYAPSFLPGLTLSANRVCLVPWEWGNLKKIFPTDDNGNEDQKLSVGITWIFPQIGFEVYGELGIDDYVPDPALDRFKGYVRYPFHTLVYTVGAKKTFDIIPNRKIFGELFFEWNSMEMSQDFQFMWDYSFYFHHLIRQGYTNNGQFIGAGSAWGGSSQYFEFKLYYPKGTSSLFIHRNNPDNNFLYSKAIYASANPELLNKYYKSWKSNFSVGILTIVFINSNFSINTGFIYNFLLNPNFYFNKTDYWKDDIIHNFSINFAVKFVL
jgi:hypothetical protein